MTLGEMAGCAAALAAAVAGLDVKPALTGGGGGGVALVCGADCGTIGGVDPAGIGPAYWDTMGASVSRSR